MNQNTIVICDTNNITFNFAIQKYKNEHFTQVLLKMVYIMQVFD